jgi:hypothetical protein
MIQTAAMSLRALILRFRLRLRAFGARLFVELDLGEPARAGPPALGYPPGYPEPVQSSPIEGKREKV